MKKTFALTLAVVMLMALLAGCGGSKNSSQSENGNTQSAQNQTDGAKSGDNGTASTGTDTSSNEVVTLKFGTWNNPEIEQKKIDAFEKTHPNIKIEIDKSITWPWDEKLGAAAAAGKLPDVFFVFNAPNDVASGWLADLTPMLKEDPDYNEKNIFGNLSATGQYNGKQYVLPHQLFTTGVLINVDLFNKENIPLPKPNWTVDDFEKIAKKLTKPSENQFGVENILGARESFVPQFDPSLGWLTYDGKQFNFDKPAFSDAIHWINNVVYNDKSAVDFYDRKEQDKWYGKDKSGFVMGKVGMKIDANWAFADLSKNAKFKWDFLPIPGKAGQRVPMVTDYIGMAASTKHPKEAFEFIKWLTYSKEGWLERINNIEKPISTMPLINDREVWDAYLKNTFTAPGLKDVIAGIPNGFVDGYKWLPGDAEIIDKVLNPYDTKKDLVTLKVKPEDVAKDIQNKAMDIFNKDKAQIDAATK
ncbi:extracellular solute-binding protein [Paenibacillus sediminis]|uniref:Multiple sugar transport system substrate-binding protein n=1 Tax=Paenibacillus sediminis TaxID=664909 RepID=A0ABS4GZE4_9BACL|nr:extracellular solute-binding protein [Paenibacillus sediminis]MBP1935502.1 multiple sugar transport system substrate-binding protein [Paenibacillus sediminis]